LRREKEYLGIMTVPEPEITETEVLDGSPKKEVEVKLEILHT